MDLHPHYTNQHLLHERFIRTILWTKPQTTDPDYTRNKEGVFVIPNSIIESMIIYGNQIDQKNLNEDEVMEELKRILIKKFTKKLENQKQERTNENTYDYQYCLDVLNGEV